MARMLPREVELESEWTGLPGGGGGGKSVKRFERSNDWIPRYIKTYHLLYYDLIRCCVCITCSAQSAVFIIAVFVGCGTPHIILCWLDILINTFDPTVVVSYRRALL